MPLSPKGNELKGKFAKQYGPEKGKKVFYATENSNPKFAKVVKKG